MVKIKNFAYLGPQLENTRIITKLYDWNGPIGCDVETVSLEDTRPIGVSFAINPGEGWYFSIDSPLLPWHKLQNPGIPIIFHNFGFDVPVLEGYKHGLTVTNILDSCIAAKLLGLPAKLSELCWVLFDRVPRPISDLIGTGKDQITMDQVPEDKVAERAIQDARDCLEAWEYLKDKVPPKALDLEIRVMPVALDMQARGIRIDRQRVHEHRQRLEKEFNYLRTICEGIWGFSPGSSMQLAASLEADGYKVPYKRGTDGKSRPNLDKKKLKTYYSSVPKAMLTQSYRSTQSLLTHLIKPLDEGRYLTGERIHPRVNLDIAESGRVSRSKPATQNIKKELRDIVIPGEGLELLDWDFSQIEARWSAYRWEDKAMLDIFKHSPDTPAGDIHQGTADRLIALGLGSVLGPTPELQRWTAKQVNFTVIFGGDEWVLWERYQIPTNIGAQLVPAFFKAYPGIAQGIKDTETFALKNGYTETYYGRRRDESEKLNNGNRYVRIKALRELVNHVIQGSAAETLKEAMWVNKREPQIHTVHDQVILEVEPGYQYMGHLSKVAPFETPIEIKRGTNWRAVK